MAEKSESKPNSDSFWSSDEEAPVFEVRKPTGTTPPQSPPESDWSTDEDVGVFNLADHIPPPPYDYYEVREIWETERPQDVSFWQFLFRRRRRMDIENNNFPGTYNRNLYPDDDD